MKRLKIRYVHDMSPEVVHVRIDTSTNKVEMRILRHGFIVTSSCTRLRAGFNSSTKRLREAVDQSLSRLVCMPASARRGASSLTTCCSRTIRGRFSSLSSVRTAKTEFPRPPGARAGG